MLSDPHSLSTLPSVVPALLYWSSEPCVADETQARRAWVSGESGRHTAQLAMTLYVARATITNTLSLHHH